MKQRLKRLHGIGFALSAMLWIFSCNLSAQTKGIVTGLDISLESLAGGYYDRTYRARGIVYEIVGIAGLRPASKAKVRARLGGKWETFISDSRGNFEIALVVPAESKFDKGFFDTAKLEIEVSKASFEREYTFSVQLNSPLKAVIKTDRNRYEPGEMVHVWSRIDDVVTGRPLAGIPVELALRSGEKRAAITSTAGVATADFKTVAGDTAFKDEVSVSADKKVLADGHFSVGRRASTDLLVDVLATPKAVRAGEPFSVEVKVRSVRGTPMAGAEVSLRLSEQKLHGTTSADGIVTFSTKAPAYSNRTEGENVIRIEGTARHAGCRAASFDSRIELRTSPSYRIDVFSPRGGLVPEVEDQLIVSLKTTEGLPAKAGTVVRLRSAAFGDKEVKAVVNRHGLASVPIHLMPGDYAVHVAGDCESETATSIDAVVSADEGSVMSGDDGAVAKAHFCVKVFNDVLVFPVLEKASVGPGESVAAVLKRRPSAAGLKVMVELECGDAVGPIETEVALPSSNTVRLTAPKEGLGVCTVRARPLLDGKRPSTFGIGAFEAFLLRPIAPSFPSLTLDRDIYSVKGRATLTVHTAKETTKSWAAVLVRDLAQHQGERPFDDYFLKDELTRAALDPSTPEKDLLLRVTLADASGADEDTADDGEPPRPEMEIDAVHLASVLIKDEAAKWMVAVEQLLSESLDAGTVEDVAVGRGASMRFRDDAVALALKDSGDEEARTLGEGRVTPAMLTELDPSFSFDTVAQRVARNRLVRLWTRLSAELNPDENDESRALGRSAIPLDRLLSDMVRRGVFSPRDLYDPWGNAFAIRKTKRPCRFVLSSRFEGYELSSPGQNGIFGDADDVRDPWQRSIPQGTLYARASGEDKLMAALSAVSPGTFAFEKLVAAYERLNDEAIEELIGDGLQGNLGTIGHGGGGGSGSGYGRGSGGLGGRRGAVSRVSRRDLGGALAGLLREDFPATLYFNGEIPLSPSGVTEVEIPLAHAATTYLVEVIEWREDGWRWSASTEIHVDQDFLVDTPLPERATVGDEIQLPIRIFNRTDAARTLHVVATGTDALGIVPVETAPILVPAKETIEVPAVLVFPKAASGTMTFAALDDKDNPVDAVRRSIVVRPSARRARTEAMELMRGFGRIALSIPEGAEPVGTSRVTVSVGPALFRVQNPPLWSRWSDSFTGFGAMRGERWDAAELKSETDDNYVIEKAAMIGAAWNQAAIADQFIETQLEELSDLLHKSKSENGKKTQSQIRSLSRILILLSPAALHAKMRPALARSLPKLMKTLRIEVENGAALFADAPWLSARCAAALLWTAPPRKGGKRAKDLLTRARAAVVTIDGEPWFEGGRDEPPNTYDDDDSSVAAAAYLAVAELRSGEAEAAFQLMRSLRGVILSNLDELRFFYDMRKEDRIMAEAAVALLGEDREPSRLTAVVDKETYPIELTDGVGEVEVPRLGRGGLHSIEIRGALKNVIAVQAEAGYTVEWTLPPKHPGPFAARIEGKTGRADERSDFKLVVRNRIPRLIPQPVVEISLPAGAEMDEEAKKALSKWTIEEPLVSKDILTLKLRPMRPKEEVAIPLAWLWTSAGKFKGLGVTAWAADRPEALSVLPEDTLTISKRTSNAGGL